MYSVQTATSKHSPGPALEWTRPESAEYGALKYPGTHRNRALLHSFGPNMCWALDRLGKDGPSGLLLLSPSITSVLSSQWAIHDLASALKNHPVILRTREKLIPGS
jgi:hypothetical protein